MFIETEQTPNPATLKFLPGRAVMPDGTLDIRDAAGAGRSPLAQALFSIEGVSGVFFGSDFVSVTKDGSDWAWLKPAGADGDEFFDDADLDTVDTIKDLIETRVRPAVAGDGGDITFKGFKDGIVYLKMKGACAGCPSSSATLKSGIQNLLKHFVPEVHAVEQI